MDGDATRRTKAAADTGLGRVRSDGPEAASEPGASFVVYVRTYCHLCDEMLAELETMRSRQAFTVEVIDIDADPALEALYGEWVPVLEAHGRRLCHYRLDPDAVAAYLSAIG